jgi:hypothetical protein
LWLLKKNEKKKRRRKEEIICQRSDLLAVNMNTKKRKTRKYDKISHVRKRRGASREESKHI